MKKLILATLFAGLTGSAFAQNVQLQLPEQIVSNAQQNLLDEWINKQGLIGKVLDTNTLVNNQSVSLNTIKPTLPEQFKGYVIRVIKPNTARTMEYSYQRINIELDNNNIITNIFIG